MTGTKEGINTGMKLTSVTCGTAEEQEHVSEEHFNIFNFNDMNFMFHQSFTRLFFQETINTELTGHFLETRRSFVKLRSKTQLDKAKKKNNSPSCCNGLMFSNSSPLMLTATMWVVQLDMPGSKQVTAAPRNQGTAVSPICRAAVFKEKDRSRYLGWPPPPLLCSQFLPLAPAAQLLPHLLPHPSALSKTFPWRFNVFERLLKPNRSSQP